MKPDARSLLIAFLVAAGVILLLARFFAGPAATTFGFIWSIEAAIVHPFELVFETRRLSSDLAAYQRSYAQALTELSTFHQIEKENATLRAQLGLAKRPSPVLIAGHLVYAEQSLGTNRFLVRFEQAMSDGNPATAGSVGRPVVSGANVLIGKVSRVSGQYAWVTLATEPSSIVSALTSKSGIKGIVRGSVQGRLTMELARHEQLPVTGEAVLTDTLDPSMPPNLLVGTVGQVGASVSGLLNLVDVEPAATLPIDELIFIIESW